jgi:hypothetical protein
VPDETADSDTAAREAADPGAAEEEIDKQPPATSAPTSLAASC